MSPIPQSGASLNLKDITRAKIESVVPDPENQQHKSAKSNFDSGTLGWGGEQKFDLTARQKILCGAGAGAFCRVITNPFDLVKIRFQVQAEPISYTANAGKSKYQSLFQAFRAIKQEEGLKGFYKGHLNGQVLSILCGIIQYGCFEVSSKALYNLGVTNNHINHFCSGYFSALNAIFICYPFDILRTRFSSQPDFFYKSNLHAVKAMYNEAGLRGFYRGVVPAVFSQAPQASIFFGMYSVFRSWYDTAQQMIFKSDSTNLHEVDLIRTTVCSFAGGIFSKICLYPMDLIKKRMQIQGFGEARKQLGKTHHYSNSYECARSIVHFEGFLGLYKGLIPGLVKAAVVSSSSLLAYEIIKNGFVRYNMATADPI